MHTRFLRAPHAALLLLSLLPCGAAHADDIDNLVKARLREQRIPGLSLAVIKNGAIVREQAFGVTDNTAQDAVTPATLFQAASISKSVAAVGALRLVEMGKLTLDADVNRTLRSWKVADNDFSRDSKVTLRGLLSNSAGLGVPSFPGYAAGAPLPTLRQVLDGAAPANTAALRVELAPRSAWRYSGGGYALLQQLMIDAAGQPFEPLMNELVLKPFGMARSSFSQPLKATQAAAAAHGHMDGKPLPGGWHLYPEQAAAGLWTTPADLARFAIGLQQAFDGVASAAGAPAPMLSQAMTRDAMSRQIGNEGLGLFVMGLDGRAPSLWYGGRNRGFDAFLWFTPANGNGIVVMINANDNAGSVNAVARAIAASYGMEGFPFP